MGGKRTKSNYETGSVSLRCLWGGRCPSERVLAECDVVTECDGDFVVFLDAMKFPVSVLSVFRFIVENAKEW